MKNKSETILKQIIRPFVAFMIVVIIANAIVLGIFTSSYYLNDQFKEASQLAENARAELESYKSLNWLFDYWEANSDRMEKIYEDNEAYKAKDRQLRETYPMLGELCDVDEKTLDEMDEEDRKIFAELCYSNLCRVFDRMKQSHAPLYLYCFEIRDKKEVFIFITGTRDGEKRLSEGGELFELGYTLGYTEGEYPVLDKILSTGESTSNVDMRRGRGADRSVVQVFEPVGDRGKVRSIIGVSIKSAEMLSQMLGMMKTMLLITLVFFAVMLIQVIYHIKKVVVVPIMREQKIIEEYEHDKDSLTASRQLQEIKTHNEIERMAVSFSSMVTELDRYMEDYFIAVAEKERIGAELNVATRIQADMLPRKFPPFPQYKEFDLYATMTPAKEVGGDFYDFFLVDDDHLALVMADVSGKGVPAALFMVIAKTLIKNHTMLGKTPSEVLEYTNEQLCEGNEAELFVTVWMAIIEISTGKGIAANAGHEHPAIKRAEGGWELVIYKHSPAVATFEGLKFAQHEFELNPGDTFFVYTDGVAEATDANEELYGTDRMLAALSGCGSDRPKELLEAVKNDIDAFVGSAPQFDDITMLGFHYGRTS